MDLSNLSKSLWKRSVDTFFVIEEVYSKFNILSSMDASTSVAVPSSKLE